MYSTKKKFDGYDTVLDAQEDVDDDEDIEPAKNGAVNVQQYFNEMAEAAERVAEDPFAEKRTATIADREVGKYNAQRQKLQLSPGVRYDPFAEGSQTPDLQSVRRTHHAVMRETQVLNDKVGLFGLFVCLVGLSGIGIDGEFSGIGGFNIWWTVTTGILFMC